MNGDGRLIRDQVFCSRSTELRSLTFQFRQLDREEGERLLQKISKALQVSKQHVEMTMNGNKQNEIYEDSLTFLFNNDSYL